MWKLIKRAILRAIRTTGYTLVRLPLGKPPADLSASDTPLVGGAQPSAIDFGDRIAADKPTRTGDRFAEIDALLNLITPWSGDVPKGYVVDFLGILTDGSFLWNKTGPFGGHHVRTSLPTFASYGEAWFEVADWFYSAREARGQYVAISLGAAFRAQLVGAWKALQAINPLPARLVAVEPVPKNCDWTRKHMAVNGIDPDEHWIMQAALGPDNEPILFPVGAPGTGLTTAVGTNSAESRQAYADMFRRRGHCERVLKNILLYNSTGITHELGLGYSAEIKFVSAVTLRDVLSPFDRVDLLEVDIQQSEVDVIAPCMDIVKRKVRRVHAGTHGREVHAALRALFSAAGWEIIFDYTPDSRHVTEGGPPNIGDGILTARNPALDPMHV
jgi:FkbM family methyltransferase